MYGFPKQKLIASVRDELIMMFTDLGIISLIFGDYNDINEHDRYLSPFREDNTPKCFFRVSKNPDSKGNHKLLFFDLKYSRKPLDSVELLALTYNLDTKEAVQELLNNNKKFKKIKMPNRLLRNGSRKKTIITFRPIEFEDHDITYWNQFEIDEDSVKVDFIYAISHYKINDAVFVAEKHSYAICCKDCVKIYQPYSAFSNKKRKFITDCSNKGINGIYQKDCDYVIITKSYKDYKILTMAGFNSVWLHSESSIPSKLKEFLSQFNHVYIFFDNDNAGKKYSKELCKIIKLFEYNVSEIFLEGEQKDPGEFVAKFSRSKLIIFLNFKIKKNGHKNCENFLY